MAKPTKAQRAAADKKAESEALKAEAIDMATVESPQAGGASIVSDEVPSVAKVKEARKEALEQQFAAADEKGAPSPEELRDIQLGMQVRGY